MSVEMKSDYDPEIQELQEEVECCESRIRIASHDCKVLWKNISLALSLENGVLEQKLKPSTGEILVTHTCAVSKRELIAVVVREILITYLWKRF